MLGTKEQRTEGMKKQAQELIAQAYDRGFKAGQENASLVLFDNGVEQGRDEMVLVIGTAINMSKEDKQKYFNTSFDGEILGLSADEIIAGVNKYESDSMQEKEEEQKLKPCPFCGSTDIFVYHSYVDYSVRCRNCLVRRGEFETEEEAIAAWNKRAGDAE